jgi:deoxyadenosine/deoxycytidine kinase
MIKRIIGIVANKFNYDIKGNQFIYVKKFNNNKIISLIGFGGKTTLVNELSKKMNLKKIRPFYTLNELYSIHLSPVHNKFMNYVFHEESLKLYGHDNAFSQYNTFNKLLIISKYRLKFSLFFDEGFVKGNYKIISSLVDQESSFLKELFHNHCFIIIDITKNEFINRLLPRDLYINKELEPEEHQKFLNDYYEKYYSDIKKIQIFLNNEDIPHIVISEITQNNINRVISFLNQELN